MVTGPSEPMYLVGFLKGPAATPVVRSYGVPSNESLMRVVCTNAGVSGLVIGMEKG